MAGLLLSCSSLLTSLWTGVTVAGWPQRCGVTAGQWVSLLRKPHFPASGQPGEGARTVCLHSSLKSYYCLTLAGLVCLEEKGWWWGAGYKVPPNIGKWGKGICRFSSCLCTVTMRMRRIGETWTARTWWLKAVFLSSLVSSVAQNFPAGSALLVSCGFFPSMHSVFLQGWDEWMWSFFP